MRAILLAALLLAPLALADHVYSHRLLIEGRLIGSDGHPLPGRVMRLDVEGERLTEPCAEGHKQITDEWGDFWFCYHRHEVSPGATVRVSSGNATQSLALDADLRRVVFYLKDANATGTAPVNWETTFFLDGRVWERGPARLDGVNVSGLALAGERVNLTVLNVSAEGSRAGKYYDLPTNAFGDYAFVLRLRSEEAALRTLVRVTANDGTVEAPLDAQFHRLTLDLVFPMETGDAAPERPPGLRSGPIRAELVVVMALALGIAVLVARRKG